MDSNDEQETLEDRILRQIIEESLKQSKQEEQERFAASETEFQDQLLAAQEQNRLDQQKREQELEARAEAELQEQIKQAMEMNAQAERERVQKSKERAEQQLLKMDREFGSKNQPGVIVRSATIASMTTSNARVVESRAPIRSSTVPSPPVGGDNRAPMVRSIRNELSVVRHQIPSPSPSISLTIAARGTSRQTPTRSPSIFSTRTVEDAVRRIPTQSSTVSSTRNEHDDSRQGLARSVTVSPARNTHDPISSGNILPSTESRSSLQPGDDGRDQKPDPSPRRQLRTQNGELPINSGPELVRRLTSLSTSSRNRSIRPTQDPTRLDEDNGGQNSSDRPRDVDPSIVENTTSPRSPQLECLRTLPSGNRIERGEDSRPPESRPRVNGSRPPSERSASRLGHLPNEMPLRTRTIQEGSRKGLQSRRTRFAELGAPGPTRREVSSRPRPVEVRIPSMSQETDPRVNPTQHASTPLPSPQNNAPSGSTMSAYTPRNAGGTPGAILSNERDTPVDLDPGPEMAINTRPSTLTTLTEEELAGLTDEQILERALSASVETRVLADIGAPISGPLDEELAGMTEEHMLERAMRDSAAMTLLDASRPALNLTEAQLIELDNEQMQRATDMSRGDDPEEAAQQREFDKLMSELPRYHEIVGTWDEWHEKKKGIEPCLRRKRLPEYNLPSQNELTYATSWAEEISLEKAMKISNRDKDEYWNRVERGEITDTGTSQGQETTAERKAKGAQQKAHIIAVAAMPTAKELQERYAQGNRVSQDGQ